VGLESDGTVLAVGDNTTGQLNVGSWTNIIQVAAAGNSHTVGLESDGTVVAAGDNSFGQCDVTGWTGITQVDAGWNHTVGLVSDGTVVATGDNTEHQCDVGLWSDIIQVSAGGNHTVGLKSDGTVVATGDNTQHQCDVGSWEDIVQVSAGDYHTVGLKSDGTVVAVGYDAWGQVSGVSTWTGITQVSAGGYHTVGLGSVVAVGNDGSGQVSGVSSWTNITRVATGKYHTVGLRSDGTVVAVGDNTTGQCGVTGWNLGAPTIPHVVGDYAIKGSIKFYDWKCNKWIVLQSGNLYITYQDENKIKGYFKPGIPIEGWPTLVPVDGYVGPFTRDANGKIKNTPRLSLLLERGTYCTYPSPTYVTYILNGKVKWDKKTDTVKSIKCTINGWGEYSDAFVDPDHSASQGQFEGKFTATPMP
jgi:alpha-tubulin suppressor-like RCC1 family protein